MKKLNKLMKDYFDSRGKYLNTLSGVFSELCHLWVKSDTEKKISFWDEDDEGQAFLVDDIDGKIVFPQHLDLDEDNDLSLYVVDPYGKDEYVFETKEWIDNDELIAFLIEKIAEHLGFDLESDDSYIIRCW